MPSVVLVLSVRTTSGLDVTSEFDPSVLLAMDFSFLPIFFLFFISRGSDLLL